MDGKIRELFLEREKDTLSDFAFFTRNTKGRLHEYTPCLIRTEYQRDRDKIIHCQSFRRLMNKTQVFLAPLGDHYRTRMTHTLEVSQIARIIARALRLNEDLTEAIALGHDLGHTPFGHAGEMAMQKCFDKEFTHYKQSLRVVDRLEYEGKGLNLTYEVRDGIVNHTGSHMAQTLEGIVVKFADRIAYINHDIDDACRAGILKPEDIPLPIKAILGNDHSTRINSMVTSIIKESEGQNFIRMEPEIQKATDNLREFLFENVYFSAVAKAEEKKSQELLISLFEYYLKYPDKLPGFQREIAEKDGLPRSVCDFISGMTDRYAIEMYTEIYVPKVWRGMH